MSHIDPERDAITTPPPLPDDADCESLSSFDEAQIRSPKAQNLDIGAGSLLLGSTSPLGRSGSVQSPGSTVPDDILPPTKKQREKKKAPPKLPTRRPFRQPFGPPPEGPPPPPPDSDDDDTTTSDSEDAGNTGSTKVRSTMGTSERGRRLGPRGSGRVSDRSRSRTPPPPPKRRTAAQIKRIVRRRGSDDSKHDMSRSPPPPPVRTLHSAQPSDPMNLSDIGAPPPPPPLLIGGKIEDARKSIGDSVVVEPKTPRTPPALVKQRSSRQNIVPLRVSTRQPSQPRADDDRISATAKSVAAFFADAAAVAEAMVDFRRLHVRDRRYHLRLYKKCFPGRTFVDFFSHRAGATGRAEAIAFGVREMARGALTHVVQAHDFEDKNLFYRFVDDPTMSSGRAVGANMPSNPNRHSKNSASLISLGSKASVSVVRDGSSPMSSPRPIHLPAISAGAPPPPKPNAIPAGGDAAQPSSNPPRRGSRDLRAAYLKRRRASRHASARALLPSAGDLMSRMDGRESAPDIREQHNKSVALSRMPSAPNLLGADPATQRPNEATQKQRSSTDTLHTPQSSIGSSTMSGGNTAQIRPKRPHGHRRRKDGATLMGATPIGISQPHAPSQHKHKPKPPTGAPPKRHLDGKGKSSATPYTHETMLHQFPAVEEQTRAGLFVLLRVGKFIKKQAEVLRSSSTEMRRIQTYEQTKLPEVRSDRMKGFLRAVEAVYAVESRVEKEYSDLRDAALCDIVTPVFSFYEKAVRQMDEMARAQQHKSSSLETAAHALSEARKACLKRYKELKTLHDKASSLSAKHWKEKLKVDSKRKRTQEAAHRQFAKAEKMEKEYEVAQKLYRHTWLPQTLQRMRGLEVTRLELQKQALASYGAMRLAALRSLEAEFQAFHGLSEGLDAKRDLRFCCASWEQEFGRPPPLNPMKPLPCTSEDLKTARWLAVAEEKAKALQERSIKSGGSRSGVPHLNTPIDKTTTLEEEEEEWVRAVSEWHPEKSNQLRLEADDIIHVLNKTPKDYRVVNVCGSLLEVGDLVTIRSMSLPRDTHKAKSILSRLGYSSSVERSGAFGKVVKVWTQGTCEFCELQAQKGSLGSGTYVQELVETRIDNLSGCKATVLYDYVAEHSDRFQALHVSAGDEVTIVRKATEDADFVHAMRADGKCGVLPSLYIKPRPEVRATRVALEAKVPLVPSRNDSRAGGVAHRPRRGTLTQELWFGLNIRNMKSGLFPSFLVCDANEKAKDFEEDIEDDAADGDGDDDGGVGSLSVSGTGTMSSKHEVSSSGGGGSFGFGQIMTDMIKGKVSKKKRRFINDRFNLDLSYITPNIIAMGFPSTGIEAKYRNNMGDVQRFLRERHDGKFWIWNLCIEKGRGYDPGKFDGCVTRTGFHDHNPCPFDMILPFCRDVEQYLKRQRDGVAVVHCKAGKGRTGFLISCYFIYTNSEWFSAARALRFFALKRTKDAKGVTIPSQRRYVYYFEQLMRDSLKQPRLPETRRVRLMRISLLPIPFSCKNDSVHFKVWSPTPECNDDRKGVWKSKGKVKCRRRPAQGYLLFDNGTAGIVPLQDDAKFTFLYDKNFMTKTQKLFHFWINTRFLHPLPGKPGFFQYTLSKPELDKAHKDKKHEIFADNFRVEMEFFDENVL